MRKAANGGRRKQEQSWYESEMFYWIVNVSIFPQVLLDIEEISRNIDNILLKRINQGMSKYSEKSLSRK